MANELAITAAELVGGNARTGGLTSSIYALWDMLKLNPSLLSLTQKRCFVSGFEPSMKKHPIDCMFCVHEE